MGVLCSKTACNSSDLDFVQRSVSSNCVVIFSKSDCPHSQNAKKIFDELKTNYKAIELDRRGDGSSIQTVLGQITGNTTVPRIFINGECVGGASETRQLKCTGKLSELINRCLLQPPSSSGACPTLSKGNGGSSCSSRD